MTKCAGTSPASGHIGLTRAELNGAKSGWNHLIVRIVRGYKSAYDKHITTLNTMKRAKEAEIDGLVFLLSVVSVGFAGGLVGGLIAPWVKKAADKVVDKTVKSVTDQIRNRVTLAFRTGVQDAAKRGAGQAIQLPNGETSQINGSPYLPVVPDALDLYLEKQEEFEGFFSKLDDYIDELDCNSIRAQWSNAIGQIIVDTFRKHFRVLADKPSADDAPPIENVTRTAETLMWIQWAKARDWHSPDWRSWAGTYRLLDEGRARWEKWWEAQNKGDVEAQIAEKMHRSLADGVTASRYLDAINKAKQLHPILLRFLQLNKGVEVQMDAPTRLEAGASHLVILDLRKVRDLPPAELPFPSFDLLKKAIKFNGYKAPELRGKFLDDLSDLRPAWMR